MIHPIKIVYNLGKAVLIVLGVCFAVIVAGFAYIDSIIKKENEKWSKQ